MTEKEYLDKRRKINEQYKKDIDDLEMIYYLNKTIEKILKKNVQECREL